MKPPKKILYRLLMTNAFSRRIFGKGMNTLFPGSAAYWEKRYRLKGNSGKGSYGKNAEYKAAVLNDFVSRHSISKVIEFGCGDGNQLKYFNFPDYVGLDVSTTAIQQCKTIFKEDHLKQFYIYPGKTNLGNFKADLSISLDVIFHLVEDEVFEKYMIDLFMATSSYVIIYAWDVDGEKKYHVRQRNFSKWIKENIPSFHLKKHLESDTINNFCDFFIYEKNGLSVNSFSRSCTNINYL